MIEIVGTHGTSVANAQAILGCDKMLPAAGRCGTGVYLWKDSGFALDLARDWHAQCLKRGDYHGQEDQTCAIFRASIQLEEELEFFDATSDKFRDKTDAMLGTLLSKSALRGRPLKKPEDFAKVHDLFIKLVEKERGVYIRVVAHFVSAPGYGKNFYTSMRRQATCYVVRYGKDLTLELVEGGR